MCVCGLKYRRRWGCAYKGPGFSSLLPGYSSWRRALVPEFGKEGLERRKSEDAAGRPIKDIGQASVLDAVLCNKWLLRLLCSTSILVSFFLPCYCHW